MNISVINIKKLYKKAIKLVLIIIIIVTLLNVVIRYAFLLKKFLNFKLCSSFYTSVFYKNREQEKINKSIVLSKFFCTVLGLVPETKQNIENGKIPEDKIIFGKDVNININSENNIEENYNYTYKDIKIKNQSIYTLNDTMFSPDNVELKNKKIIIYHTHTCESYTPSDKYNYEMTGNYRTTDINYNVVKLGDELDNILTNNGFNIIHSRNYHDYPAYNGSYERSLKTIEEIITNNQDIDVVIDLHRDAVGDGSWYGPTVSIGESKIAQMMFVIRNRWRRTNSSKLD